MSVTTKDEQFRLQNKKKQKQMRFRVKKAEREKEERLVAESLRQSGIDEPPQSLEQELQIDDKLQMIYEDSDEESPERFHDPNELMHILSTLED